LSGVERTGAPGGILYIVATPIGNPEDITLRAIRVLREADLIACEDTRRAGRMLAEHDIHTPTLSYFEHNERRRTPELVERLKGGQRIALITDAGTPTISDPGYRLVSAAIGAGIRVTAVPGASAVVAALSMAGLPTDRFAFEGFIPPRPAARQKLLASLAGEARTMVFFETARRLGATLDDMATSFGSDCRAVVIRELTKTFEQAVRGTLKELGGIFARKEAKGEVTLVVDGAHDARTEAAAPAGGAVTVEMLCEVGLGLKEASAIVAKLSGASRREVYQQALLKRRTGESS
jgi:16S rRNA (cytidine1402-2'-O)-methyltransferase